MSKSDTNQTTLIFMHLPKTGGRTFRNILNRHYSKSSIVTVSGKEDEENFRTLPATEKAHVKLIYGHMQFGLHAYLEQPARYLTLLRDPIDRMVSHYYFVRERPHQPQYALAQQYSLAEYFDRHTETYFDNQQTRLLAGARNDDACTEATLQQAKHNLDTYFDFVGLTERFDEFLLLVQKHYGWSFPYYYRANESTRPNLEAISPETLKTLEQFNPYDIELYRYAQQCFERQLQAQQINHLERFQFLNRLYSFPFYVARAFKRNVVQND